MNHELIEKAKKFCSDKHNLPAPEQRYGSAPYSVHLEDVVNTAKRYLYYIAEDKQDTVIIACFCHDLEEDTELDSVDITKIFNAEVADIVFRVTNERGRTRKEKNFKTYPKIWSHELAIYVKLSDRISNGRNSKNGDSEKSKKMYKIYKEEYPVFRYALNVGGLYKDMWAEADEIFDFYGINDKE